MSMLSRRKTANLVKTCVWLRVVQDHTRKAQIRAEKIWFRSQVTGRGKQKTDLFGPLTPSVVNVSHETQQVNVVSRYDCKV